MPFYIPSNAQQNLISGCVLEMVGFPKLVYAFLRLGLIIINLFFIASYNLIQKLPLFVTKKQ